MDRHWFLTWATYGTWLPGDKRGFVSKVVDPQSQQRRIENIPGTPYLSDRKDLQQFAAAQHKGEPVYLKREQPEIVADQFVETAQYRSWKLLAVAVMRNHVHIVVGVHGDPEPETLLRDFESYASRRLNRQAGKPPGGTWWTVSGSKRKLRDKAALMAAINYLRNQEHPLVVKVMDNNLNA